MGTLDPNDPRLQAPRSWKRSRWGRAAWSGALWCIGGLLFGFLFLADLADEGDSVVIRSRLGLATGAISGFLGLVLPLILPTKAEREEDG